MTFKPSTYIDAALFVGSDLDLGNATASELEMLMIDAIAQGFGYVIETATDSTN